MLMEDHHWLPFNGFCLKPHIDAVQTSVNDLLFLISDYNLLFSVATSYQHLWEHLHAPLSNKATENTYSLSRNDYTKTLYTCSNCPRHLLTVASWLRRSLVSNLVSVTAACPQTTHKLCCLLHDRVNMLSWVFSHTPGDLLTCKAQFQTCTVFHKKMKTNK